MTSGYMCALRHAQGRRHRTSGERWRQIVRLVPHGRGRVAPPFWRPKNDKLAVLMSAQRSVRPAPMLRCRSLHQSVGNHPPRPQSRVKETVLRLYPTRWMCAEALTRRRERGHTLPGFAKPRHYYGRPRRVHNPLLLLVAAT
jgi:hypothetical protein